MKKIGRINNNTNRISIKLLQPEYHEVDKTTQTQTHNK